jgi:predicted HTH transcriptional regulator
VESIIERSKERYYLSLRQTQATLRSDAVNWQPWLLFFLKSLLRQTQALSKKIERERLVMVALPEPALHILEHAKEHGRVTIGDMAKLTGISRNTLKGYFRRLVADGHLTMHGEGRGVWYVLGTMGK